MKIASHVAGNASGNSTPAEPKAATASRMASHTEIATMSGGPTTALHHRYHDAWRFARNEQVQLSRQHGANLSQNPGAGSHPSLRDHIPEGGVATFFA